MKKLSLFLALCLISTTLISCGNTETPSDDTAAVTDTEDVNIPVCGGWNINPVSAPYTSVAFSKCDPSDDSITYTPVALLGSHGEGDITYAFLCLGMKDETSFLSVCIIENNNGEYSLVSNKPFDLLNYVGEDACVGAEELTGGWTTVDWGSSSFDAGEKQIFESALYMLAGVNYTPIACLATQVVAGTNHAFLAIGTTMTMEPIVYPCIISVYEDLEGDCELLDICAIDINDFCE